MTAQKHTQGPWSVYDGQWGDHSDEEGGGFQIIMGPYEGGSIFTHRLINYAEGIFPEDKAHEEAKANARLIAAAPDMLDALYEAEEYFYNHADADHDETGFVPNKEMKLLTVVRAAIAKATGQ